MKRFLQIALGSASELEYQALLAKDLGFLSDAGHACMNGEIVEVKKMLASLMQKLRADG
jgi:four helix bundle protein